MKIAIGCDHTVTDTKMALSDFLKTKGHEVLDMGAYDFTWAHYPVYGKKVGETVVVGKASLEVCLYETGVGINSAVNEIPDIRSTLVCDMTTTIYAKEQLDASVVGFGTRITEEFLICDILDAFIQAKYQEADENQQLTVKIKQIKKTNEYQIDPNFFNEFIEKWNRDKYQDCKADQWF